ncbi:cation:proton antiporter domain-containing protein [Segnochrobactrum spirostomi]|uniref:cation:proton antiporter domain-containing protein n=1 Tax=Segnochrobactrum spirostomi TaxID=2608987 RepID=UPI001AD83023|nr:cation:proton antiporter [Segnochrobactrum spirostomi]
MHEVLTLQLILAAIAGLLVVVALLQPVAERLQVPASVLLATVGILIGAVAALILYSPWTNSFDTLARVFVDFPITADTFLYIFLPLLLFQTALSLDVRRLVDDIAPILLLAVVAVLVATAAIGFTLAPVSGQPLVACLLLGAIVATTDPVAVIAIFRELGAPARLTRLVEGESLLNDAAAITLFVLLLELLLTGKETTVADGLLRFAIAGIGGAAFGYFGGLVATGLFRFVREIPAAIVTISVAVPYLVFIGGEELFHVSGVVAAVAAGVAVNIHGPTIVAPDPWRHLREIWEQIEFWAASLIFVLASILVPHLLGDIGLWDLVPLGALILAAFLSRALVLFALLPLLSFLKVSERVSNAYKVVIVWGGLRGAVTLALALSVTENAGVPPEIQRFIAATATGFTLFTLLVNGTTLRSLIHVLKLDQISAFDVAMRDGVVAVALGNVKDALRYTAETAEIPKDIADRAIRPYDKRIEDVRQRTDTKRADVIERDRLKVGLVALADRERELVLELFRERTVSIRIIEHLLTDIGRLRERARTGGRVEYNRAAKEMLGYSLRFRIALRIHRWLGWERLLSDALSDRFERILVMRIVLTEMKPFVAERLNAVLGERLGGIISDIVDQRHQAVARSLAALELQYPDYAQVLEERFLTRSALRREELEYDNLFEDRLIGTELLHDLKRGIKAKRAASEIRPKLDLGLDTRQLVAQFPLFKDLDGVEVLQIAKLLRPRFAVPGERLIRRGERGESVFFISSGAVEVALAQGPLRLGRGDFIGELALITGGRRSADVTAISYCNLLILEGEDFQALLARNPDMNTKVQSVAAQRLAQNQATPMLDEAVAADGAPGVSLAAGDFTISGTATASLDGQPNVPPLADADLSDATATAAQPG